jgi:hypothetical protein
MARKKRVKPTACVVCHKMTIYENAAENHPYGFRWEGSCYQCGANQRECAWVAQLYTLPLDTKITLECDRWHAEQRAGCKHRHNLTLGDVLLLQVGVGGNGPHSYLHPYAKFRGGCPVCGHFITGEELMRHDLSALKHLVPWYACVEMYSDMKTPCCPFVKQTPPPTGQFVCVETAGTFPTEEEAWVAARKRYDELIQIAKSERV